MDARVVPRRRHPPGGRGRRLLLAALIPLAAWTDPPDDMPLPVDVQVSILWRVWGFDRAHEARVADRLVVAVAYQPGYRASALVREQFETAVRELERGRAVHTRLVAVDVTHLDGLEATLEAERVDILYLAPVRAIDVRALTRVTRSEKVLSCTGVPSYMDVGIALGVDVRGGRPQILVNLSSARDEGARLSAELLRRARVMERAR